MNHNDINRQCAEAMRWRAYNRKDDPEYYSHTPPGEIQVRINDFVQPCPDFCNEWGAMRILVEYAEARQWDLCLIKFSDGWEATFAFTETEYYEEKTATAPLAVALAFLKCFGKEE